MDLVEIIRAGLEKPKEELGDRTTYVGSSDLSCERKGCLNKLLPQTRSVETLLKFKRGDLVEDLVKESFDNAGVNHEYQYEAIHPLKAHQKSHLDFTFVREKSIGVLECKSVTFIPQTAYEEWEKQLFYQMGLLAMKTEKKIKGAVLAVDLITGDMKIFNGYQHNPTIFRTLEESADRIWRAVNNRTLKGLKTSRSVLCSYCPYRPECPAFFVNEGEALDLTPIHDHVEDYVLNTQMEKESKNMRYKAKGIIEQFMGENSLGTCGEINLRVSPRQRGTTNYNIMEIL